MILKSDSWFFKNWVFLTCCRLGGSPDKLHYMSRYALSLKMYRTCRFTTRSRPQVATWNMLVIRLILSQKRIQISISSICYVKKRLIVNWHKSHKVKRLWIGWRSKHRTLCLQRLSCFKLMHVVVNIRGGVSVVTRTWAIPFLFIWVIASFHNMFYVTGRLFL